MIIEENGVWVRKKSISKPLVEADEDWAEFDEPKSKDVERSIRNADDRRTGVDRRKKHDRALVINQLLEQGESIGGCRLRKLSDRRLAN